MAVDLKRKEFEKALKTIKGIYIQYWNGYHMQESEMDELDKALKLINQLPKAIETEVGVDYSDDGLEW